MLSSLPELLFYCSQHSRSLKAERDVLQGLFQRIGEFHNHRRFFTSYQCTVGLQDKERTMHQKLIITDTQHWQGRRTEHTAKQHKAKEVLWEENCLMAHFSTHCNFLSNHMADQEAGPHFHRKLEICMYTSGAKGPTEGESSWWGLSQTLPPSSGCPPALKGSAQEISSRREGQVLLP